MVVNLSENQIYKILDIARFAPSSHNTQPWKFTVRENGIEVFPDFEKALNIVDPDHRELYISLGCAIANIEVIANNYGYEIQVSYPKHKTDPIKVDFKNSEKETIKISEIKSRQTDRGKYSQKPLPEDLLEHLKALCKEGIYLEFLSDDEKEDISKMVYEGDMKQFANPKYRKELSYWIKKGVMGGGKISNTIGAFIVSNFNPGKLIGKKESSLIKDSPAYAVLGSHKDRIKDWISIGISYERIALYLTSEGISNHPMNQGLLELNDHRERISDMCEEINNAQFGFRIGYGEKNKDNITPRQKLDELLIS